MRKAIVILTAVIICGCAARAQQSFPALRTQGQSVEPNTANTNGGYVVFKPISNNPYNGAPCFDNWGNPVQQPVATAAGTGFGANDLVLWDSLSPSLPFNTGIGAVQGMQFNTATAPGPCGIPLNVNLLYGLNTNGYLFARGGLSTDNPFYNSIQTLQGGVLAGSFTAAMYYPPGTTTTRGLMGAGTATISGTSVTRLSGDPFVGGQDSPVVGLACGFFVGALTPNVTASCYQVASIADADHLTLTAAASLTGTQGWHVAFGLYLGGHVDVGHSVGAPASGPLSSVTNPFTQGEGAVAGQMYFEDSNSTYPTYLPCLRVFNGSAFGCAGDVSEVYSSFADHATSPATTAAFQTSTGTMKIFGSGDFQGQTFKATSTFNSLSTGTIAAFQQNAGTFVINGDGKAFFQLLCANGNPTTEACTYGLTGTGALTAASAAAATFNSTATGTTSAVQQASGNFQVNGDGKAFFQLLCASGNPVTEACTYGMTSAGALTAAGAVATVFNSTATGTTSAVQQSSGNFQVNGDGKAFFQLLCANGNSSTEACTYGLTSGGALTVASCTGCGSGVTSWNTRSGAVTLTAADVAAVEQDLRTSASPAFAGVTATAFNSSATGTSSAVQQAAGNFQVNGDGKAFFQLLCASGNPVSEACTYGLTSGGALTVASCTGCGSGVTSWNTRTGAVTLTAADVAAVEQDLRTSASPAFAGVTATAFNSSATGTTSAVQQAAGNFQVNGDGKAFFQLLCASGNPVSEACTYGLTSGGALTVASCTGCGSGVTSLNSMTGALSVTTSSNGITVTPVAGSVLLAMSQDLRSSAAPSFNAVTASTFFNCAATGTNPCIKQASGTWSVNGQGDFAGQSLATGANNGTTATAGAGAVINKSGSAVALRTYDSGGTCGIGTGEPAPGIACSSDARLKTHVVAVAAGLDAVMALRPVTFRWIGSGAASVGFIAQEVQAVLPGLVTTAPDSDYLMLSEDGMVPYLVRAVQELQAEIAELRK